jgi:oligopeptide transport system permease protein
VSAVILLAMILGCALGPELSSYRYDRADLKLGATPPSWDHWMGTDYFGRDLMARVFFGGRISFAVGLIATLVSFTIGVSWGGIAGYFGGKVDAIMMRVVDALYTFPFLVLVILLMVFFANDQSSLYAVFKAILGVFVSDPADPSWFPIFQIVVVFAALGAISWLTMARIVRGQVISLRGQPFIEAARSIGVGHAALIFRHLIPNALGPIIVYTTLTIPEVMMTEAFLSFLGLGTQEPLSSWGLLASTGAETMDLYPWQLIFPALMLAVTLICFNFLGDGLRDALDPRIRKD